MKIEDNPAFAEKLPRICFVLGGEKTPLKVGEEFKAKGHIGKYRIHGGIIEWCEDDKWESANIWDACEFINQPEVIIRRPQFSDDEKALMREYMKFGYTVLRKPKEYGMRIESEKGWIPLPDGMFPQITPENSPFNFAAYLESEESK